MPILVELQANEGAPNEMGGQSEKEASGLAGNGVRKVVHSQQTYRRVGGQNTGIPTGLQAVTLGRKVRGITFHRTVQWSAGTISHAVRSQAQHADGHGGYAPACTMAVTPAHGVRTTENAIKHLVIIPISKVEVQVEVNQEVTRVAHVACYL